MSASKGIPVGITLNYSLKLDVKRTPMSAFILFKRASRVKFASTLNYK